MVIHSYRDFHCQRGLSIKNMKYTLELRKARKAQESSEKNIYFLILEISMASLFLLACLPG